VPDLGRRDAAAPDTLETLAGVSFVLFALALPIATAPMYIAGGLCLALALAVWIARGGAGPVRTSLALPSLAWLAAMGLATLTALDRAASARSLGKGLIPLAVGVLAWHAARRRWGAIAIVALFIGGGVASLIGTGHFFATGGRFPARAIGLTGSWMTFGLQLMLIICVALGILIAERRGAWRAGAVITVLTCMAGLVTSFTRSAWLALVAGLVVLLGLRRPRALVALALVATLAWFTLPGDLGERLRSAFDPAHVTNRERVLMWDAGMRAFRDRPWTGAGIHNLTTLLDRYRSPAAVEHPAHVHNSYLHVAVSTGIVGLIAFLVLCGAMVATAVGGTPRLHHARGLGVGVRLGVAAGTVGFLVAALFDHVFGDEQLLLLVFALAGLAWGARGWGEPAGVGPAAPKRA
jgi:O-antigen ligase